MVNLNFWLRLSETQYTALMSIYGDEQAMKFAINMEVDRFIKKIIAPIRVEHITPDISKKEEIA